MINITLRNFLTILEIDKRELRVDIKEMHNSIFLFFDYLDISYSVEVVITPQKTVGVKYSNTGLQDINPGHRFDLIFIIQKFDNLNSTSTFDVQRITYDDLDVSVEIFTNAVVEEKIRFV